MATDKILAFFNEHQRPYSVTDVQNAIKDIGKAAIQKAINELVEQEKLREKAYGKQKVYFLCQNDATSSKQLNEDVLTLDRQINDITSKMQEDRTKLVAIEAKLAETKDQMSLPDALEKKIELQNTLKGLKEAVKQFEGRDPVAPEVKKKVQKEYEKRLATYKKRKRMCLDMLDAILENYPKTKKQLYEEVGLETDEDVGFTLI